MLALLSASAPIAKSDSIRLALQSCINLEYANVIANAPKNISQSDAYKKGYSSGFDFIGFYKKSMQQLPNPESTIPEMLSVASQAGYNMAQNLTKEQIIGELKDCRNNSAFDFNAKQKINEHEIIPKKKFNQLANQLNSAFFEYGVSGLSELVSSCYNQITSRGYDCLVLDMGARYIANYPLGTNQSGYFSDDTHSKRVQSAINKKYYQLADALSVKKYTVENIEQALIADINSRK